MPTLRPRRLFLGGAVWVALVLPATSVEARGLGEAGELEAARANARAGGPTSERDKDLLTRYGCLSGTNSTFCRRLEGRANDSRVIEDAPPKRRPHAVRSWPHVQKSKRNND